MAEKLSAGQIAARKAWDTRRRNAAEAEAEAKADAASNAAHKAWDTRRRNAAEAEAAATEFDKWNHLRAMQAASDLESLRELAEDLTFMESEEARTHALAAEISVCRILSHLIHARDRQDAGLPAFGDDIGQIIATYNRGSLTACGIDGGRRAPHPRPYRTGPRVSILGGPAAGWEELQRQISSGNGAERAARLRKFSDEDVHHSDRAELLRQIDDADTGPDKVAKAAKLTK
tara:strand:- start:1970 stop:2665 length:696 start_codon:yes stop_codon:yes gene_type:complete